MANKNIQLKGRNGDLLFPRTRVGLLVNESGVAVDVALKGDLPTKVSELTNDAGYITVDVATLANYYLKSETYTKSEVENLIAAVKQFSYEVVTTNPESWDQTEAAKHLHKIVLFKPEGKEYYVEYIVIENPTGTYKVEKFGDTDIKLENYYTKSEIDGKVTTINQAIAGKVAQSDYNTKVAELEEAIDGKVETSTFEGKVTELETAIGGKVDKVEGKGLSTEDFTTAEKNKLAGIAAGAQVNVIEKVKLNGKDLTPDAEKRVDLGTIATSEELTALGNRVDALETKVGTKAVSTQISEAIEALDLANTYYGKALGEANASAISGLQTRMTTAEGGISDNAAAISALETSVSGLGTRMTTAEGDIDALEGLVGSKSVATQISEAIAALKLSDTYYSKSAGEANATAIAGIKNGTSINNFAGVEGAISGIEDEIAALPFITYEEIA